MNTKVAFIGAGIATSYTLINLVDSLLAEKSNDNLLTLYIIDKSKDFFKGLPYGDRSSNAVLLINDLKSFIPQPNRNDLKEWLNKNYELLIEEFLASGGRHAKFWVQINIEDCKNGRWDDLFIPRFFFGRYVEQKVNEKLRIAEQKGIVKVERIHKEVKNVIKTSSGFEVIFDDDLSIKTKKVVLSIGSLTNKKLFKEPLKNKEDNLYVNDIYVPTLDVTLNKVLEVLRNRNNKSLTTNFLILGANASGLESIYRLSDIPEIVNSRSTFTVLSTNGAMPDGTKNVSKLKTYDTENMNNLMKLKTLTAAQIADAVGKDLDRAEAIELGAASTVGIVSNGFSKLLTKLSREELVEFACNYGNQIGKRQRLAGKHYLSVTDDLSKNKRLEHLKGRFHHLKESKDGLELFYKTKAEDSVISSKKEFNIVFNCLGSVNFDELETLPLFKNLFDQEICAPNKSKIGITVNENLEASSDFYIAGPMLAGNLIKDRALWHLEHCERIIWSSNILAEKLIDDSICSKSS